WKLTPRSLDGREQCARRSGPPSARTECGPDHILKRGCPCERHADRVEPVDTLRPVNSHDVRVLDDPDRACFAGRSWRKLQHDWAIAGLRVEGEVGPSERSSPQLPYHDHSLKLVASTGPGELGCLKQL